MQVFHNNIEVEEYGVVTIDGNSYNNYINSMYPEFQKYMPKDGAEYGIKEEFNNKTFQVRRLPKDTELTFWDDDNAGWVKFDTDTFIPMMIDNAGSPWMSITPMEVTTCRNGALNQHGTVLVGGLGLGWITKSLLENDEVHHVTVYELDEDVIEFIGRPLLAKYGHKLRIINESIYEAYPSEFDCVSIDIHMGYGDAEDDDELEGWLMDNSMCHDDDNVWVWGYNDTTHVRALRFGY